MINNSIPDRIGISQDQIEIHQSLLHAEIILLELNDIGEIMRYPCVQPLYTHTV